MPAGPGRGDTALRRVPWVDGGRRVPIPIGVLGWCPDATWEHPQGPWRPQRTHDPVRPTVGGPFPVARSALAGPAASVIGSVIPRSTGAVVGGLMAGLAVVRRG